MCLTNDGFKGYRQAFDRFGLESWRFSFLSWRFLDAGRVRLKRAVDRAYTEQQICIQHRVGGYESGMTVWRTYMGTQRFTARAYYDVT